MQWRLGLDMGTNSIGWSMLELQESSPKNIIDMGVRIFSDGRVPKTGESLAVERRNAKGMRKNKERLLRRKKRLANFLQQSNLLKKNTCQEYKNPYYLRVKGLDEQLTREELGRVLLHLGMRRGFKSNRKDTSEKDNERSLMKLKIKYLKDILKDSGCRTLGELLYKRLKNKQPVRFRAINVIRIEEIVLSAGLKTIVSKNIDCFRYLDKESVLLFFGTMSNKAKQTFQELLSNDQDKQIIEEIFVQSQGIFPDRGLYEDELEQIKQKQSHYYNDINWTKIKDLIFYQRPLQKQERGKCRFYFDKQRAFKALPSAQLFRLLQDINNLSYIEDSKNIFLSIEQKNSIFNLASTQKTLKFTKIKNILKLPTTTIFNLEKAKGQELKGLITEFDFKKYFNEYWSKLNLSEKDNLIEAIIDADEDEKIELLLANYELADEIKELIFNYRFEAGTSNMCKEFLQECSHIMQTEQISYYDALIKLNLTDQTKNTQLLTKLPYYGVVLANSVLGATQDPQDIEPKRYGKINNPTVHIGLNQLRKIVNELIENYGAPAEISIELARELKLSKKGKDQIAREQNENKKINKEIKQKIKALTNNPHPDEWDIKKYKLWVELGNPHKCIYCGKTISAAQLFNGEADIEHILPYSQTLLNSMNNLTVAHSACNQIKGNKTPFEAFANSANPTYSWQDISERSKVLPYNKQKNFTEEALKNFQENSAFINRQITDNAYLSRKAREYLGSICPLEKIVVSSGRMTALLREKWGINKLLSNHDYSSSFKNRSDHRHHALDALVIAMVDRKTVTTVSTLNANNKAYHIKPPEFPFKHTEIKEKLRNLLVSIKPEHGLEGRLFTETAYGKKTKLEKISINEIKKEDIENIVSDKIKNIFLENTLTKAKKLLSENQQIITVAKEYLVTRKNITALSANEIKKGIFDDVLGKKIIDFIGKANEKELPKKLQQFAMLTGVRRARVIAYSQEAMPIASCDNKKNLCADDFIWVDIWQIPPHKTQKGIKHEGCFISRAEANLLEKDIEYKDNYKKRHNIHPAAKKLCRLYKNDVLVIKNNNNNTIFNKVAGFSATNNCIDIRPLHATNSIEEWLKNTADDLIIGEWPKKKSTQNFISINKLFGTYNFIKKGYISVTGELSIAK